MKTMADVWVLNNEVDMFSKELMFLSDNEPCATSSFEEDLIQAESAAAKIENDGIDYDGCDQYSLGFYSNGGNITNQLWKSPTKHSPTLAELNGTEQDEILPLCDSSFCPSFKRQKAHRQVNSVFNLPGQDSRPILGSISCTVSSQPPDLPDRFDQTPGVTVFTVPTSSTCNSSTLADALHAEGSNGQSVGNVQLTVRFQGSLVDRQESGVTVTTSPVKQLKLARHPCSDQVMIAEPVCKKRKVAGNAHHSLPAVTSTVDEEDNSLSAANYQSSDSDIENIDDSHSDEELVSSQRMENSSNSQTKGCTGFDSQRQYFWLYNVQAKGPKSFSVSASQTTNHMEVSDPHVLSSFEDPAQANLSYRGRQCRAGDIEANPRRLMQIGAEIDRLSKVVSRPSSFLTPREKNKYASRICRLKRKAQFEANKIKLQGLDSEHAQLMHVLDAIKSSIVKRVKSMQLNASGIRKNDSQQQSLCRKLEHLINTNLTDMIAEHTDEFVSCQLEKLRK